MLTLNLTASLLEARLWLRAQPLEKIPDGASPATQAPELYPTDLLRALILLERGGELRLTTAEARQTITGALSEPQRLWLRSNPAASEERPGGIPEVRAGDLARELQGLLEAR